MFNRDYKSYMSVINVAAKVTLLLTLIISLMACNSKLNEYSDAFNPVLQQHMDLYTVDFADVLSEAEEAGNSLSNSANPNVSEAVAIINRLNKKLDNITHELAAVNREWSVLFPPKEAQRFHELVFEMMQVRLQSVENTLNAYTIFDAGQIELSLTVLQKAYEFHNQGDLLFTKMLAEGRTLGDIEIIRD